jgi:hypothetical protein
MPKAPKRRRIAPAKSGTSYGSRMQQALEERKKKKRITKKKKV